MAQPRVAESREGWALFIFSFQLLVCAVIAILYEVVYQPNDGVMEAIVGVGRDMASAVIVVTATTVIIVEGYAMLAERYLKKRYSDGHADGRVEGHADGLVEGRTEGLVEGHADGLVEGRTEGHADGRTEGRDEERSLWQAWYQRRLEAENEGLPFDEPPPGSSTGVTNA